MKTKKSVSKPKDASTVLILRNVSGGGIETLMVRRHPESRFCSNFYVYPGGCIDSGDCRPRLAGFCEDMDPEKARRVLRNELPPEKSLGSWVAAIRETFEEAGILLAYKNGAMVSIRAEEEKKKFNEYRKKLIAGKMTLEDMLSAEGLKLASDRLHYFSHWITPEALPYRYDVRFFVAESPACQEAVHDGIELTDHVWISPSAALAHYAEGRFGLVLPTISTLREIASFKTVADVIRSTKGKHIPAILTRMEFVGGRYVEIMPDGTIFGPDPS